MLRYKSYTLHNYKSLPQTSLVSRDDLEAIDTVGRVLPFKTNNYIVEQLIDWNNIPNDPVFTLSFPRREMLRPEHYANVKALADKRDFPSLAGYVEKIRLGLNPNPSGQRHNIPEIDGIRLDGMQHKYRETVLLFPKQGQTCFAFCSFCFRWPQFSDMEHLKFAMKKDIDIYLKYIRSHPEITDILLTGGDPMTMSCDLLKIYIEPFLKPEMENIRTIRIGTKSLSYWPYRYTTDEDADEIIRLFERIVKSGKHLSVMAHFNHYVELSTDEVKKAIKRIRSTGAQIRTQSPVLKHINDSPEIWAKMWQKQVELGCSPYYMFIARETGAKHFFELPLERCQEIFRKAYQKVSGIARTARGPSMSCYFGKIQILGVEKINDKKVFVMRFIQGRNPDWVAKPFFAEYNPDATWITQLKPLFGDKFFFES
ncbi:MAG: lysine 2,3-aminomutase [Prevotellaceae bacterium]|jgi:KamA family protein|nr:lysine 2,3-aminomutase [Prevotellaceae bacterium]